MLNLLPAWNQNPQYTVQNKQQPTGSFYSIGTPGSGSSYSSLWNSYQSPYPAFSQQQGNIGSWYQGKVNPLYNQLASGNQDQIAQHLSNLMGGQRSQLQSYVNQAANAGIQRGGMNVAGGVPLASQLALQANQGLAGQYASDYGQAANLANQDRNSLQSLLSQVMGGAQNSYGNQLQGLAGQQRDFAMRREDYGKDILNAQSRQAAASLSGGAGQSSEDPLSALKQRVQQQQLMAQLEQLKNQQQQGSMQTDAMQRQNEADQFKQDAWQRKYAPYQAASQQWVGAPSYFYGGMNNMNLADAMRAPNQWSGYRQYR